ncbi:hypothetical protein QVD17_05131 [Tagetes erecta]|uniref:Uncharacterized protein n=1 Tax=Tagetes erecta TaxID=13708 RepID=A0AAD8LKW7_TARER|nr:hypothetical protein QVD17_16067 [Tagetes erecta]KAK1439315.1 hypothetical protein QVD17_05131 [Tagetes erecta]
MVGPRENIFSLLHHLLPPSHRSTASSSSSTISIFHHPHRSTASSSSSTKNIFSLLHHHLHLHQPLSASRILFRLCCLRRLFSLFPERKNDESKQVQRSKVLAFAARYALFCNIIKMLFGADDAEYDKIVLDSVPSGCSGVLVSASVDSWDLGRPAEARFELLNQVLSTFCSFNRWTYFCKGETCKRISGSTEVKRTVSFHKGLDVWSVGNRSSARPDWQGRGNLDYILASEAATKLQHQKQQHALAATKKQVIL